MSILHFRCALKHRIFSHHPLARFQELKDSGKLSAIESEREKARLSLERYMHYWQRWAENNRAKEQVCLLGSLFGRTWRQCGIIASHLLFHSARVPSGAGSVAAIFRAAARVPFGADSDTLQPAPLCGGCLGSGARVGYGMKDAVCAADVCVAAGKAFACLSSLCHLTNTCALLTGDRLPPRAQVDVRRGLLQVCGPVANSAEPAA